MGSYLGGSRGSLGTTSLGLLERMKAQDQDAWERFATLYGHIALAMCRRAGLQPVDRDDVFQEVALAVARHLGQFRRERPGDSFRAWLKAITRTKILDLYRRAGRQPNITGGTTHQQLLQGVREEHREEDGDDSDDVLQWEDSILAHEAIKLVRHEFEERTWQAFWRTVADGLSASVAADQLGMSPGAVRVAKSRVLRRIRDELEGLID